MSRNVLGTNRTYLFGPDWVRQEALSGMPLFYIGSPESLGLSAKPVEAEFEKVFAGGHHTRAPQANFRRGYHTVQTFSAEVSVALLLGPDAKANVRKFVMQTVVEPYLADMKSRTAGRDNVPVRTVALVRVDVESAAGGPEVHVHVVEPNAGRAADGRVMCVHGNEFWTKANERDAAANLYAGDFFRRRSIDCRGEKKGCVVTAVPEAAVAAVCKSTGRANELMSHGLSRRAAFRKARAEAKAHALANPDARPKSLDECRTKWIGEINVALAPRGQSFEKTILPALKGLERDQPLKPPPGFARTPHVAWVAADAVAKDLDRTRLYTPAQLQAMVERRCVGLETTPEAAAFWGRQLGHSENCAHKGLKSRAFPSRGDNAPLVVVGAPDLVDAFAKKFEAREARREAKQKAAEERARPAEPLVPRTWPGFARDVLDTAKVALDRAAAPVVHVLKTTTLTVVIAAHAVRTAVAPPSEMRFRKTLYTARQIDNFIYDHTPEKRSVAHRRALVRGAFARSVTVAEAEYRAERRPDRRLKHSTELVVHDPKRELTDKQVEHLQKIAKRDGSKLRLIREPEVERAREQLKDRTKTKGRDDSRQL